jgi:Fur family ferric uptake transcriptional regulator
MATPAPPPDTATPSHAGDERDLLVEAKRRLAESDQRLTPVRRRMVEVFSRAGRPLAVHEIVDAAAGTLPVSSVYRNLAVLTAAGVTSRCNFDEGFVRYELDQTLTSHHHHLVCSSCRGVVDVADAELAAVEAAIDDAARTLLRRHGFVVRTHAVDLIGECATCAGG